MTQVLQMGLEHPYETMINYYRINFKFDRHREKLHIESAINIKIFPRS